MNLNTISDSAIMAEYTRRFEIPIGEVMTGAEKVAKHLRPLYKDRDREQFFVMFLNGRNALIDTKCMFKGSLMSSAVYPREIIKECLRLEAAAIIISHNHPSGSNYPSKEDINLTKIIKDACKTMDITVHDHIIIARENYYSFADKGEI
jgi:DNA repair protein RadC